MTNRHADQAIRRLAARQYGLLTRKQATGCGLDRAGLERRIRSGDWEAVTPRVLRLLGTPVDDRARLLAAVLDAGADAAACGRSAAALLGIPGYDLRRLEVAVPRGSTRTNSRLAQVHERVTMRPAHRCVVNGIPSTIVPIMLLDVIGNASAARAERAVDYALSRRLVTVRRLRQVLDEPGGRGRAGTALLRRLVDARSDIAHPPTGLELRVLQLIRQAGLPVPQLQVDVGDDAWIGRVDFRWDTNPPVILEVDSDVFHTSLLDREADAARDARLRAAGHVVGRVTEQQVWHRPREVVAVVNALLRRPTAQVA